MIEQFIGNSLVSYSISVGKLCDLANLIASRNFTRVSSRDISLAYYLFIYKNSLLGNYLDDQMLASIIRTTWLKSKDEYQGFGEIFDEWLDSCKPEEESEPPSTANSEIDDSEVSSNHDEAGADGFQDSSQDGAGTEPYSSALSSQDDAASQLVSGQEDAGGSSIDKGDGVYGADCLSFPKSAATGLQGHDVRLLTSSEQQRVFGELINQLRTFTKFYKSSSRSLDLRKIAKSTVKYYGETPRLFYSNRRHRVRNCICLLDCSESMAQYRQLQALATVLLSRNYNNSSIYLYSSEVRRLVSPCDLGSSCSAADILVKVGKLDAEISHFCLGNSGGTLLLSALEEISSRLSGNSGNCDVFIMSDCLDASNLERLSYLLKAVAQRCGKLVVFNPLFRFSGFKVETSSMRVIEKHSDYFIPLYSVLDIRSAFFKLF